MNKEITHHKYGYNAITSCPYIYGCVFLCLKPYGNEIQMIVKCVRIFSILLGFLASFSSSLVYADDFTAFNGYYHGSIAGMHKFVAGREPTQRLSAEDLENLKVRLCKNRLRGFLRQEGEKIAYNDIFHEMNDEVQRADVIALKEKIEATDDCIERFKLWIAYDDRWYRDKREKTIADRKALEEGWKAGVKDTGEEIWDGVIEGVYFAIPRKYMWFGSRRDDGLEPNVNLQFYFPDMGSSPANHPDYKGMRTNIGGVTMIDTPVTRPCPSVGDREYCTEDVFSRTARPNTYWDMKCERRNYYFPWLASFEFDDVFDEDVGLWTKSGEGPADHFFEGHFLFPDYALTCVKPPIADKDKGKGICTAALRITDDIFFSYSFPRELFWKHREIYEAVRLKLESFIVKAPTSAP